MYRDEREVCPRCSGDLLDAGAGRACAGCAGMWIDLETVHEMALAMQTPAAPIELPWTRQVRAAISCPVCNQPMETLTLYGIALDVCEKKHGVWFDAHELGAVLFASSRKRS